MKIKILLPILLTLPLFTTDPRDGEVLQTLLLRLVTDQGEA